MTRSSLQPRGYVSLVYLGALLACSIALIWHSLQYNFVTDDAYISFVYARNLAEHGALVFNPGDPVEGYTNFLWTFVLGVLYAVGVAPEVSSLVLGTAFAVATQCVAFLTVAYLSRSGTPQGEDGAQTLPSPWALMAPALLALSAGFACWSSGGLETQMFTFWVILALYLYARGAQARGRDPQGRWLRWVGPILALAAMTRPEGLLVTAVIGAHRLATNLMRERRLRPSADELACLGGFLAIWAPWYVWRFWYYGYPFPNTYYVKAGGEPPPGYTAKLLDNGLYYVWQWARQSGAVYVAPLLVVGLIGARRGTVRLLYGSLALPLGVLYLLYTIQVGGDFMGLHRFVMPVTAICAIALPLGVRALVGLLAPGRGRVLVGAAVAAGILGGFGVSQMRLTRESLHWGNWVSDHGIDTPAFLRIYTLDRAAIGAHMRTCFREDDFSIVGGAGAQPYYGRMRAIDVFGLVSEEIAHTVGPTVPRAGHNKWAPDTLLLRYEPEFVFSCYSIHTHPRQPHFNCNPAIWQRKGYEVVTLHIPTLQQNGQYYSFLKRKDRELTCPGMLD